jgi:hypothetical protein
VWRAARAGERYLGLGGGGGVDSGLERFDGGLEGAAAELHHARLGPVALRQRQRPPRLLQPARPQQLLRLHVALRPTARAAA